MKTKILLVAALLGVASLSAQARVAVGFSFGLPVPVPVVAPAFVAPAPIVACPGPGYVWTPGYYVGYGFHRSFVPGCWNRPAFGPRFGRFGHR